MNMNEADLERYIRKKSNGRNIVAICIINLLLYNEIASRNHLWQDVLVYVRKNYTNLPSSYDNPRMRRNLRRLQKRFDGAISSLVRDGVITKHGKKDEFMLGLDVPLDDDYDEDHPLGQIIYAELDVTPKDPVVDFEQIEDGNDFEKVDVARAMENIKRKLQNVVSTSLSEEKNEKNKKLAAERWRNAYADMADSWINREHPLAKKTKRIQSQPSVTKSIGNALGTEATDEMVAYKTIREMEKTMRKFVAEVMRKYGNWWGTRAPTDVRKQVHDRMKKKKVMREHSRSDVKMDHIARFLNDTDLGQLIEIIRANRKDFDKAFKDEKLRRIDPFLTGLYEKRNVIDHIDETIPIDKEFLGELDFLCKHVMRQMEVYYQD